MLKISGVFNIFENLETIHSENIIRWLKPAPESSFVENYLANKIIYPMVLSQTAAEQNIDLAILREALQLNTIFFKPTQKKIFIPATFLQITPDIQELATVFIDAYNPKGIVTFILSTREKDEILGSLVSVSCSAGDTLYFVLEDKNFKIKPWSLAILSCPEDRCHVNFKSENSTIFGKNELIFEVSGGRLGLIVDGRRK